MWSDTYLNRTGVLGWHTLRKAKYRWVRERGQGRVEGVSAGREEGGMAGRGYGYEATTPEEESEERGEECSTLG